MQASLLKQTHPREQGVEGSNPLALTTSVPLDPALGSAIFFIFLFPAGLALFMV